LSGRIQPAPAHHVSRPPTNPQGIETVRRDNCALVRNVVGTCLDHILVRRDVGGAVSYVKGIIADLLLNRVDLSLLVISKVRSVTKGRVGVRG
jgi:DNA polymerase elongation subunit (family B)